MVRRVVAIGTVAVLCVAIFLALWYFVFASDGEEALLTPYTSSEAQRQCADAVDSLITSEQVGVIIQDVAYLGIQKGPFRVKSGETVEIKIHAMKHPEQGLGIAFATGQDVFTAKHVLKPLPRPEDAPDYTPELKYSLAKVTLRYFPLKKTVWYAGTPEEAWYYTIDPARARTVNEVMHTDRSLGSVDVFHGTLADADMAVPLLEAGPHPSPRSELCVLRYSPSREGAPLVFVGYSIYPDPEKNREIVNVFFTRKHDPNANVPPEVIPSINPKNLFGFKAHDIGFGSGSSGSPVILVREDGTPQIVGLAFLGYPSKNIGAAYKLSVLQKFVPYAFDQ